MKIGTGKGLAIIAVASPLLVLWAILSVGRVRSGPRAPESGAVRSVTQSLLIYANAHDGNLPKSLADFEEGAIILPEKITIDMFIYVAPSNATTELPMDTPLIVFPWESGAHIGYLGGNVTFKRGGYGDTLPTRFDRKLRNWRIAFVIALLLNVFLVWVHFFPRRHVTGTPNNQERERREAAR